MLQSENTASINESTTDSANQKLLSGSNLDSGYVDSGFLSTSNLNSADLSAGFESNGRLNIEMKTRTSSDIITDIGLNIVDNLSRMDLENQGKEGTENIETSQVTTIGDQRISNLNVLYQTLSAQCDQEDKANFKDYLVKDEDGDTMLHNSIIYAYHCQTLKLVLNAPDPAVLSSTNKDGLTPLHLAVLAQDSGIVRLLVLSGAKLTSRSNDGNTPLHLACQLGNVDCARALLDPVSLVEHTYHIKANKMITPFPQDLEIKNYIGQACIHIATNKGSLEILRLLLRTGADLEAREGLAGKTPLMISIVERKYEVTKFFLNECRPNFETPNYAGYTAYQVALSVNEYHLARRMKALGAIAEPLPENDFSSSEEEMDIEDDDDDVPLNNSFDSDAD